MNKEHQKILRGFAMSQYIGFKCVYCNREYKSLEILEDSHPICAGTNPLKIICKVCSEEMENNKHPQIKLRVAGDDKVEIFRKKGIEQEEKND